MQSDSTSDSAPAQPARKGRRLLIGLFIGVPIIYWLTFGRMGQVENKVLESTREALSQLPSYAKNRDYVDRLLAAEHKPAFRKAYDMGSRRRAASFDEEEYWGTLLPRLIERCKSEGKGALASEFKYAQLFIQPAENAGSSPASSESPKPRQTK